MTDVLMRKAYECGDKKGLKLGLVVDLRDMYEAEGGAVFRFVST